MVLYVASGVQGLEARQEMEGAGLIPGKGMMYPDEAEMDSAFQKIRGPSLNDVFIPATITPRREHILLSRSLKESLAYLHTRRDGHG